MIIGRSKISNKVYVCCEPVAKSGVVDGVEYVDLGGAPILMAYQTDVGACSGPAVFAARHCFGGFFQSVKNKTYTVHDGRVGRVTRDFSPPLLNAFLFTVNLLGANVGVKDLVAVNTAAVADMPVAVLSGGVANRPYVFLTPTPNVRPTDLVERSVKITADFPEATTIRARIVDYAVIYFMMSVRERVPVEVLVAVADKAARPGNSSAPAFEV